MRLVLPLALLVLAACENKTITVDEKDTGSGNDPVDSGDTGDTGTVADGAISVSPATIDLGVIFVGDSASAQVTVTNVGAGEVAVTLQVVGGWATSYTLDAYTAAPAPGAASTHTLTLTPTSWGDHAVSVLIDDGKSGGHVEIPVAASVQVDADGDGFGSSDTGGDDCNDDDATINPSADDLWYDGIDSNCDGANDYDQDQDGYDQINDCDDTDATVNPGATDTWYDGIDSNCDGANDYDQDQDGYDTTTDCNDTDATINPGATETWYDDVDQNCDGANDNDQDGDGYELGSDCDDTDDTVYPGATDEWYDGVDQNCDGANDNDQDGDGVEYPTDCNDTDATVTGPTTETLNGNDDDCDGAIDDVSVSDAASGVLYGTAASMGLGNYGRIAMGSDVTGDGATDLLIGAPVSSYGNLWVIDGAVAAAANGAVSDYDTAYITGESAGSGYYYYAGWVNGPMADVDGDGTDDLVFGGDYTYYSYYSYARSYLFYGGSSITGSIGASSFDVRFATDGSSGYSSDMPRMSALGDIDGDGQADVVVGSYYDSYGYDSYCGSVAFFSGDSFSGTELDLGDATDRVYAMDDYDYLGRSLVLADIDGDGYVDAIAGASGYDGDEDDGGGIFVFAGNASMAFDTDADDAAGLEIQGDDNDLNLGEDSLAHPGDVDASGTLDLGLTSENDGDAWVFIDPGMSGVVSLGDADHNFSGTAGDLGSMMVMDSDLDGDGADEVVLGGDGDDTAGSNYGVAWVFSESSGWSRSMSDSDAVATIYGPSAESYFGSGGAGGADLDGDGREDIAIGATSDDTAASEAGSVWIIPGW